MVLNFEDMQWADDGLLDFVEHLLDWSFERPIFVCAFARPELSERRPGWPGTLRGATTVRLAPVPDESISDLLIGLVPDLPKPALSRIVSQAEGVPLYAVETVRTLADRGVLAQQNGHLELVGEIGDSTFPRAFKLAALVPAGRPERRRAPDREGDGGFRWAFPAPASKL